LTKLPPTGVKEKRKQYTIAEYREVVIVEIDELIGKFAFGGYVSAPFKPLA